MSSTTWLVILLHTVIAAVTILLVASNPGQSLTIASVLLLGFSGLAISVFVSWRARTTTSELLRHVLSRFDSQAYADASPEDLTLELANRAALVRESATRMEAERERLAAILSSMTEGVIAINRDESIVLANEASYAAMDKVPDDPIGRQLRELVRSKQIHDYVRSVLKGETPDPIECELARTNRIVTVKADAIGNPARGAVLTIHDITELRRLERIRREFVANVSHELKTPITVIQACADTLSEGAVEDPEPAKRFLNRIDAQCARLAELINDMLDLGRIEAGDDIVQSEPVDLERVLRECVQQRENIVATNQLSLTIELFCPPIEIQSDLTSVRTLVGNLTDNAIKYTPAGGSVVLELDQTDDSAIIRVRDTGIGIERQHIKRIFQRFYRVDSARSRASGGSGLGLAIVKHLAQQLGGNIEVESEFGEGSTFTVQLPLKPTAVESDTGTDNA